MRAWAHHHFEVHGLGFRVYGLGFRADRAQLCVRKAQLESAGGPERLKLAPQNLSWLHWGNHGRN